MLNSRYDFRRTVVIRHSFTLCTLYTGKTGQFEYEDLSVSLHSIKGATSGLWLGFLTHIKGLLDGTIGNIEIIKISQLSRC